MGAYIIIQQNASNIELNQRVTVEGHHTDVRWNCSVMLCY